MKLAICHLYGDLMNTYGDDGNIITLINRCQWRGILTEVSQISVGQKIDPKKFDLYFFGGGQDQQQVTVAKDLKEGNGKRLIEAVNNKAVVLAVCGGYQLIGEYYQPFSGSKLDGVGILDVYTVAGDKRMIGNIVIDVDSSLFIVDDREKKEDKSTNYKLKTSNYLVGFENHSGKTYLGKNAKPLGKVVVGNGNNGEDGTEGAYHNTVFGCYLHGSVLPKNPHFADYLINLALKRRNAEVKLEPLEDSIEWQAHSAAKKRSRQIK